MYNSLTAILLTADNTQRIGLTMMRLPNRNRGQPKYNYYGCKLGTGLGMLDSTRLRPHTTRLPRSLQKKGAGQVMGSYCRGPDPLRRLRAYSDMVGAYSDFACLVHILTR